MVWLNYLLKFLPGKIFCIGIENGKTNEGRRVNGKVKIFLILAVPGRNKSESGC
jgi:hypothetical protein